MGKAARRRYRRNYSGDRREKEGGSEMPAHTPCIGNTIRHLRGSYPRVVANSRMKVARASAPLSGIAL